jgi:hypothetical protein
VRFFLVGLITVVLSSCLSEPDCLVTASNEVKIIFKKKDTDTLKYVKFPVIKLSGTDAIYVADSVTGITLYVNPATQQTTFKFQTEANTVDTLTLQYDVQSILISPACGAYRYYSGVRVVSYSSFDTVKVTNPTLSNNTQVKNVEIKF